MKTKKYSKKGRYSGKSERADKTRSNESESNIKRSDKHNDPAWYVVNGQLAKDVASLSFNNALGSTYTINPLMGNEAKFAGGTGTASGIFNIYTVPAIGVSADDTVAPVNVAMRNIYSYVRHANSGHSNYDAPDLMMYLLAMDSLYSYYAYMTRIYGICRVYSQTNRYIGAPMLKALGVKPDELYANLSDFRTFINMFATKLSALCVPNTMSLFKRHTWMYSSIYKDEDTTKCQFYMYQPAMLWKFNTNPASELVPVYVTCFGQAPDGIRPYMDRPLSSIYSRANEMLNAVLINEDLNIMSGDILKAYGRENLWVAPLIPEDYTVLPVYSSEVLSQIQNSRFAGSIPMVAGSQDFNKDSLKLTQNTDVGSGNIIFQPRFSSGGDVTPYYELFLNMYKDEPTPEDVLVATRNSIEMRVDPDNALQSIVTACGSEIPTFATIFTINGSNMDAEHGYYDSNMLLSTSWFYKLTQFNYFPTILRKIGPAAPQGITGQIGNYTIVGEEDLRQMHESAIMSQLGVPYIK